MYGWSRALVPSAAQNITVKSKYDNPKTQQYTMWRRRTGIELNIRSIKINTLLRAWVLTSRPLVFPPKIKDQYNKVMRIAALAAILKTNHNPWWYQRMSSIVVSSSARALSALSWLSWAGFISVIVALSDLLQWWRIQITVAHMKYNVRKKKPQLVR